MCCGYGVSGRCNVATCGYSVSSVSAVSVRVTGGRAVVGPPTVRVSRGKVSSETANHTEYHGTACDLVMLAVLWYLRNINWCTSLRLTPNSICYLYYYV